MNGCCKEVIEPSVKLARMVNLLKLLEFLYFALVLLDLFLFDTGIFFMLLFQIVFLLFGISSKHFGYLLLSILVSLFYLYTIITRVGASFQIGFNKKSDPLAFGFLSFTAVFEIFCIYVVFQTYKQAKHEYRIKYEYVPAEDRNNENNNQIDDNVNLMDNNNEENNGQNGNNNNFEFPPFPVNALGGN